MLTIEDQNRVIELADAAGRASNNCLTGLADKLTAEAEKLLQASAGASFEDWVAQRNYNLERYEGAYVSKITQELYELWLHAGGEPVK